jgi:hypothetical protein
MDEPCIQPYYFIKQSKKHPAGAALVDNYHPSGGIFS